MVLLARKFVATLNVKLTLDTATFGVSYLSLPQLTVIQYENI